MNKANESARSDIDPILTKPEFLHVEAPEADGIAVSDRAVDGDSGAVAAGLTSHGLGPSPISSNERSHDETADDLIALTAEPRKAVPGIVESISWLFGFLAAHIFFVVGATLVVLVLGHFQNGGRFNPTHYMQEQTPNVISVEQLGVVFLTMFAVWLRFRSETFERLGTKPPRMRHVMMVLVGTLPLSICVSNAAIPASLAWKWLTASFPVIAPLDQLNTMANLKEITMGMSWLVMILALAICPALSEELVFRGVIGNGLTKHYGIVFGIVMTSVLFGIMHVHPLHAVAVIPLGVALHFVYHVTRTIWIPMLLHAANNTWAAILTHAIGDRSEATSSQLWYQAWIDGAELILAIPLVVCLGVLFWQTRVKDEAVLTSDPSPCEPSNDSPQTASPLTSDHEAPGQQDPLDQRWLWAARGMALVFYVLLVVDVLGSGVLP